MVNGLLERGFETFKRGSNLGQVLFNLTGQKLALAIGQIVMKCPERDVVFE